MSIHTYIYTYVTTATQSVGGGGGGAVCALCSGGGRLAARCAQDSHDFYVMIIVVTQLIQCLDGAAAKEIQIIEKIEIGKCHIFSSVFACTPATIL
jgi:hypothetical protein